ncbi:hypothetical protein BC827DRAFT_340955 [Russula dissimulans]|nr:hypothetical protein BC827DRAFT_340955 [Russula dissimulans]
MQSSFTPSIDNNMTTVDLGQSPWDFRLVMKCKAVKPTEQLRKRNLCSDLVISKWPPDEIRMLLEGAAVVRFASGFLDEFKAKKDFVLNAMFIWEYDHVGRYTLFQRPNEPNACAPTVQHVTQLKRIERFRQMTRESTIKSFSTKDSPVNSGKRLQ